MEIDGCGGEMRGFEASATIGAPAERIWAILLDGEGYSRWDSGVIKVDGTIADGETVTVHSEVNPNRAFPVRVERRSPTTMTWTGGLPMGLFTGVRTFDVALVEAGTRLSMREEYHGPLTGLMSRTIPDLTPSFHRFVGGLKAHAERG
jgi:hypothetical protein